MFGRPRRPRAVSHIVGALALFALPVLLLIGVIGATGLVIGHRVAVARHLLSAAPPATPARQRLAHETAPARAVRVEQPASRLVRRHSVHAEDMRRRTAAEASLYSVYAPVSTPTPISTSSASLRDSRRRRQVRARHARNPASPGGAPGGRTVVAASSANGARVRRVGRGQARRLRSQAARRRLFTSPARRPASRSRIRVAQLSRSVPARVSVAAPYALPIPPVQARAAYLYDVTAGRVLYAKDAEVGLPMASTTKIMTALLAIKYGHLDDMVTASYAAATVGQSTMYLQQGERLSLRDLLYGLLLPSGNDAAIAIAEHVGGSAPAFVAMMNQEAARLGMTHTHFVTPHGLDAPGHYASAHDMARLAIAAMRSPVFRQIVATRSYTIPATPHNYAHTLDNINQPLWWYPGTIGLKPGTTDAAGRCAVEWVVRGNHTLLLVLLGGANLVTDVRDLFNWGFGDFSHWYSPLLVPVYYAPEYLGWDGPDMWLPTADGGRYYVRSGYIVRAPLLAIYLRGGGAPRYGPPTSEAFRDHGLWRQRFAGSWLFYNPRTGLAAPTQQAVE